MSTRSTKGLVLQTWDYEDTSKIVTLFTENWGLVKLLAPGVNRLTSKNRYSLVTFTLGEYIFFPTRTKNKLSRLKTGHFLADHLAITENYNNYLYAVALSQIIQDAQSCWEPNPQLFWDLNKAFNNFNDDSKPLNTFVRFLFYHLPTFGGPNLLNRCGRCYKLLQQYSFFSLNELKWVCQKCQESFEKSQNRDWLSFIERLHNHDFWSSEECYFSTTHLLILGSALLDYYELVLGITNQPLKLIKNKPMFRKLAPEIYTDSVLTSD
ncbi:DNA replication and repair protein RecO [Entomoplasma freundtii]|uniref:DNA repair protein RecO n=1 Tax=Entomoplasma freundtii TaxID=74700 RepID=A0A2K8NRB0_9MOLU|nr:DNA repair protein RecO [Entomoplasma freundtii]ATZ16385.1 DNA repair protein recO [Entomoplasma freundtii]TDY56576.1 DNA replication and repair protein RecO [Entomoplasma freundtii]